MLWCGNYCSVSFKSSVLCHLVIAPVPNSITPIITLQKKSANSDWSITHLLFAHGWMVMKASTCSKPYAPLSMRLQHFVFTSRFAYKKGTISKYDYTACNHSSVKEQQRLLSISLTAMWSICVMYKLVTIDSLKSVQIMWNHYPLTVVLFSLYI